MALIHIEINYNVKTGGMGYGYVFPDHRGLFDTTLPGEDEIREYVKNLSQIIQNNLHPIEHSIGNRYLKGTPSLDNLQIKWSDNWVRVNCSVEYDYGTFTKHMAQENIDIPESIREEFLQWAHNIHMKHRTNEGLPHPHLTNNSPFHNVGIRLPHPSEVEDVL